VGAGGVYLYLGHLWGLASRASRRAMLRKILSMAIEYVLDLRVLLQ
jgi:hypothetical protein